MRPHSAAKRIMRAICMRLQMRGWPRYEPTEGCHFAWARSQTASAAAAVMLRQVPLRRCVLAANGCRPACRRNLFFSRGARLHGRAASLVEHNTVGCWKDGAACASTAVRWRWAPSQACPGTYRTPSALHLAGGMRLTGTQTRTPRRTLAAARETSVDHATDAANPPPSIRSA